MIRRPARSTLVPCTTLVRSDARHQLERERRDAPLRETPEQIGATRQRKQADQGAPGAEQGDLGSRWPPDLGDDIGGERGADRKSTRLNSSHANISYAVLCLK